MLSADEFRILTLQPHPDSNAPIVCNLQVASLDDKPEYETLSYVWGNGGESEPVTVDGKDCQVTLNLLSALRRLRRADKPRQVWIDQLCINQWDNAEKAQQVNLMRRIYSETHQCLIWLGELPQHVPREMAEMGFEIIYWMSRVKDEECTDNPAPQFLSTCEEFDGPLRAMRAFSQAENPWWERMWTIQEATMPPSCRIFWGPLSLEWETLDLAISHATHFYLEPLDQMMRVPAGNFWGHIIARVVWLSTTKGKNDTPMNTIMKWRHRKATDLRDKAYALLGLLPDRSLPLTEACKYDISIAEVYSNLTVDVILNEESLLPLIADPRPEDDIATPGMPRWALDIGTHARRDTDWHHVFTYGYYNANWDHELDRDALEKRAETEKMTLKLKGTRVDTIKFVGPALIVPSGAQEQDLSLEGIRSWKAFAEEHLGSAKQTSESWYPGGNTLREAFGHLMLGGFIHDSEQTVEREVVEDDIDVFYEYFDTGENHGIRLTTDGTARNQRFFLTNSGLMGLGHLDTEQGDQVWVFDGGRVPFTIRTRKGTRDPDADDYDFVGRCYVQGIMQGEVYWSEERIWEEVNEREILLY